MSEYPLERIRRIARDCGYAIAVHGSEQRDLDLIAVPWTDGALGNRRLVEVLCEEVPLVAKEGPVGKPYGRVGWVLCGVAGYEYVDLSITPRTTKGDFRSLLQYVHRTTHRRVVPFGDCRMCDELAVGLALDAESVTLGHLANPATGQAGSRCDPCVSPASF